jgi:hypothetical protein
VLSRTGALLMPVTYVYLAYSRYSALYPGEIKTLFEVDRMVATAHGVSY